MENHQFFSDANKGGALLVLGRMSPAELPFLRMISCIFVPINASTRDRPFPSCLLARS